MTPFVPADWLPVIFAGLMALSILLYVVLDGFDLGVGILLPRVAEEADRDRFAMLGHESVRVGAALTGMIGYAIAARGG